jgi:hypothetical protein
MPAASTNRVFTTWVWAIATALARRRCIGVRSGTLVVNATMRESRHQCKSVGADKVSFLNELNTAVFKSPDGPCLSSAAHAPLKLKPGAGLWLYCPGLRKHTALLKKI